MTLYDVMCISLGLILAFYWGRVIAMAARSRRRSGRSANFLPPETLGRVLRLAWIPAVAAWVASPFLATFDHSAISRPLSAHTPVALIGLLVAVAAFALTLACWQRMGRAWRMGINPNEKNPLVTNGPFAIVRHPIYALSTALMLASVAVVLSPLILIAAAIHLPLLQWEAIREERHMRGVHGERYDEYCRRVGRFFPCIRSLSRQPVNALQVED